MITKINSELINRIGNEIGFFFDFVFAGMIITTALVVT